MTTQNLTEVDATQTQLVLSESSINHKDISKPEIAPYRHTNTQIHTHTHTEHSIAHTHTRTHASTHTHTHTHTHIPMSLANQF